MKLSSNFTGEFSAEMFRKKKRNSGKCDFLKKGKWKGN